MPRYDLLAYVLVMMKLNLTFSSDGRSRSTESSRAAAAKAQAHPVRFRAAGSLTFPLYHSNHSQTPAEIESQLMPIFEVRVHFQR